MDTEVDDFISFGTPLPELEEEDGSIRKKPKRLEDQIVTDEKGRRRFHGAFTGGFSAGFYNSVGSVEGWAPSSFQSSRSNRMAVKGQQPEDFMDTEDLGQFGIAPRKIHTVKNFSDSQEDSKKRSLPMSNEGPIPGNPPLKDLVIPVSETMGVRLLKKLGWKPGQGIGPRITRKQKKQVSRAKIYGCSLPVESNDSSDDEYGDQFTYAPEDVAEIQYTPKTNVQGLGYKGLDKNPVLSSHISLFGSTPITLESKKKLGIRGQAFGIGAFEDEDEDIYSHEDLSQYDFSLESKKQAKKDKEQASKSADKNAIKYIEKILDGFHIVPTIFKKSHYPLPDLPSDFKPIHKMESLTQNNIPSETKGLNRHSISSTERGIMLGEKEIGSVFDIISPKAKAKIESVKKSFQTGSKEESVQDLVKIPRIPASGNKLKPFESDEAKQKRYEHFLSRFETGLKDDKSITNQPPSMTEWEKVREQEEFQKAAQLFRPMATGIANRFVSAGINSHDNAPVSASEPEVAKSEMAKAAEQKQFGALTHEKIAWHPDKLLCKRFNVPDPYPESTAIGSLKPKKDKLSIFDHLTTTSVASGENKVIELSSAVVAETEESKPKPEAKKPPSKKTDSVPAVEESQERPPIDLFKAIFEDSDAESNFDENEIKDTKPDISTDKSEIPSEPMSKPAILDDGSKTNDQNPLPYKSAQPQGVFSNINFDELNKALSVKPGEVKSLPLKPMAETCSVKDEVDILYGPKLPPPAESSHDSVEHNVDRHKSKKHKKHKHKHRSKHHTDDVQDTLLKKLKKLTKRKN